MKRIILLLFLAIPISINAQMLDSIKKKITPQQQTRQQTQPSNSGSMNTGGGNQTVVNVQDNSAGMNAPVAGELGNGWEEADWNLTLSTLPLVLLNQPSDQQFITNPGNALDVGAHYLFSERISIWARYVTIGAKGKTMEVETEKIKYDENGDPKYDENGIVQTETEITTYDTNWEHERIFWGMTMRYNFGDNNEHQMQIGLGTSLYDHVVESESGDEVNDLGTSIVVDLKYAYVYHNFAWGVQATLVKTPSKTRNMAEYIEGGYLWVGPFFQMGFPGLN